MKPCYCVKSITEAQHFLHYWGDCVAEEQLNPAQADEVVRFQISYNKQRIKATWGLAIVMVGMYLLEEYFGGSQNTAVLVRMGANVAERVRQGEYYRLFTCVFLHAGFLHVFFNTYALIALGGFFNRIMGEARFLTVFFVSGFVGSLCSTFLGKAEISVGASGAIWGIFGASLALSFFKTSLIPDALRHQLRRITLINLAINLGVSFLPMIDIWAHIGGGVAGFFVSLAIIFPSRNVAVHRWFGFGFRITAIGFGIIYAASLIFVMWKFQPWVDQLKLNLTPITLPEVNFSISMPEGLKETVGPTNTPQSAYYVFGDPKADQLIVEAHFFNESILGAKPDHHWLTAQRDELLTESSVPGEIKKSVYFRESPDGGLLYYQQNTKNAAVVVHNFITTREKYAIKIGIIAPNKIPQARIDELGKKIIESIKAMKQ